MFGLPLQHSGSLVNEFQISLVIWKIKILGHGTVHVPRWSGVDYVANLGCTVAENVVMSLSRLRRRLVSRAARDAS